MLADYLEQRGRDKVIYQRLAYLMRSGAPDSLDLIVAKNFGSLAADLLRRGESGQMVAVVDGRYTAVPIAVTGEGSKRVDVARFYDAQRVPAEGRGGDGDADVSALTRRGVIRVLDGLRRTAAFDSP